jgi:MinD superfamily P-loop ATPase
MEVAGHFNIPVKLAVNKYDLNPEMAGEIEDFCRLRAVPVVGRVPFDKTVVRALVEGKTIIEYASSPAADEIKKIWETLET